MNLDPRGLFDGHIYIQYRRLHRSFFSVAGIPISQQVTDAVQDVRSDGSETSWLVVLSHSKPFVSIQYVVGVHCSLYHVHRTTLT